MRKELMAVLIVVAVTISGCVQKTEENITVEGGAVLPEYYPLSDINEDEIEAVYIKDGYVYNIMSNEFVKKSEGYEAAYESDEEAIIIGIKGGVIAVGETSDGSYPGDVYIAKYNEDGTKVSEKTYGGRDFDYPYTVKYNENMGILISGRSQSAESIFGGVPFAALFDKDTLEFKWSKKVQFAGSADYLSDTAAYISCGKYVGDELRITVTKVSKTGETIWEAEPVSQVVDSVAELESGKVIVSQHIAKDGRMQGRLILISEDGKIEKEADSEVFGKITPTSDGGFVIISERAVRSVPQPAYVSALWTDNETVATKYSESFEILWRKTYDSVKGETGTDTVVAQNDGSLMMKKAEKTEVE